MTLKRYGIEGMREWDSKFSDKRDGYREAGPSAENIERGSRDVKNVKGYGLCDTCMNFSLIESNGTSLHTHCVINSKSFKPSKVFPVTRCSNYWNVGWLSYDQLKSMAWKLEFNKNKAGFVKPGSKPEIELISD